MSPTRTLLAAGGATLQQQLLASRLLRGLTTQRKMADAQPQLPQAVAFVGLGAMGVGIAGNLHAGLVSQGGAALTVWNRTAAVAQKHAADHGTVAVAELTEVAAADVIVSCLPTSAQVRDVATTLAPQLKSGTLWIDCTSGEPVATRAIASEILSPAGVALVDCPVSGGPSGAASGQLTAMVGGEPEAVARATSLISLFAKKNTVPCGGLGCACAVKSVNNALNVSHLALVCCAHQESAPLRRLLLIPLIPACPPVAATCLALLYLNLQAGEGLLALAKFGVAPEVALRAINGSSGRSLQTQERLPQAVLTRNFDYGFKLGLMLKDVDIALSDVS